MVGVADIGKIQLEKADDAKGEFMVFTLRDSEKKKVYGLCYRHIFRGKNRRFDCQRRPRHCLCIITRQPHFSLFRSILQDIYAFALIEGSGGMCRQYTQSLLGPFFNDNPSGVLSVIPRGPEAGPFVFSDATWQVPKVMKMQFRDAGILPLLVALGVDRMFMLLSAILSERKIALVADDHQELTAAVYGALSMIHPFTWPHNIFTVAPASIVPRIVSEPVPFIAGIRRDAVKELPKNIFDNVVVVDLDQGLVTFTGGPSPLHDLVGDSSTALKQATENLDRLRAGISSVFLGKSSDSSADSSQRDIMAMLVLDLKSVLSNRPGSNSLQSVATGLLRGLPVPTVKSEEESSITWAYESEKTLRDCLTTFFVYLFGDFEDFLLFPTEPNAPFTLQNRFDRNGFFQRRTANGLGRLQDFMNDFLRSGVFKKFLVDMIKRTEVQRALPSGHRNTRTSSVSSVSSGGGNTGNHERSSEPAQDVDDLFFIAANDLRVKQIPLTATNAKQAVTSKSTVGAGEVTLSFGLKIGNANFHQLTLLYTNAVNTDERLDNEDVQVPVWDVADRMKESSHSMTHIERILNDARNSEYIRKIFTVLSYRLESARASQARGTVGASAMRALYLLKVLLVQGPHATVSYALELLPILRQLLHIKYNNGGNDFMSSQSTLDLRPMTLRVLSLLMDHRKLMTQRQVYQLAQHSKRLYFKSAMDANKGGLVALTQAKAVKKVLFFAHTKQAGRQFQSFASIHATMNELRMKSMPPGGLKCNPFEMAELEEEEDEKEGVDDTASVVSMANPAATAGQARPVRPRPPSAEVNLLDFDHHSDASSPSAASVAATTAGGATTTTTTTGGPPNSVENPKYRVRNIDTGEVKHIREFQNIPYNTFDQVPPPKPARTGSMALGGGGNGAGSIKLQPPPNDNRPVRRPVAGSSTSSSSRSVSPVPGGSTTPPVPPPAPPAPVQQQVPPPSTPSSSAQPTAPRTPTQTTSQSHDFDAFTPTTPPAAPTPASTPASGNGGPPMKLAAGLEDLVYQPTTAMGASPMNPSSSSSSSTGFAPSVPMRTNVTRGSMPILSGTNPLMMQHALNPSTGPNDGSYHTMGGAPPARPAFTASTAGAPHGKPKDPFADLLTSELNRPAVGGSNGSGR